MLLVQGVQQNDSVIHACMYNWCLLLKRKAITNLDSILKSRDITLPTKVHVGKASE